MRGRAALLLFVMLGVAGLVFGPAIFAQQQAKPQPAAKSPDKRSDEVLGSYDYLKSDWGKNRTTLLKGHVKFVDKDTTLTSDVIELDQKTKIAVSPGAINITNPECDIKGAKGTAYFNKRLGVIEGNVWMLMKPKQTEAEKADKDPNSAAKFKVTTTITCDKLEYLYKGKLATATGGVVFKQDKRTASAAKAVYDQNKEILTLTGNVKGADENGQTFEAPTVIICLKKGEETIEVKNGSGKFKIDLGDEGGEKP